MHPLDVSCSSEPSRWCCCCAPKRLPPHAALQTGDQWCRTREPKPNCCRCERPALELVQNARQTVTSLASASPVPEPHLFPSPSQFRSLSLSSDATPSPTSASSSCLSNNLQGVDCGERKLDGSWIAHPHSAPSTTLALLAREGTPLLALDLRSDLPRSSLRTHRFETRPPTTTFIETTHCLGRLPSPPEPRPIDTTTISRRLAGHPTIQTLTANYFRHLKRDHELKIYSDRM